MRKLFDPPSVPGLSLPAEQFTEETGLAAAAQRLISLPAFTASTDAATLRHSVVRIVCGLENNGTLVDGSMGTGFFVGIKGENPQYLVTNHHVISDYLEYNSGQKMVATTNSGDQLLLNAIILVCYNESDYEEAYVVEADEVNDFAVLRLAAPTDKRSGLPISIPNEEMVGSTAYSVGFPGAAVTLQGRAAMALADESTPMSNGTLTLEDSAVYSFVNSNKTLSLKNMEIVLKDSAALMLGGGTAQLEGCTLTLGSGAQAHLESSQTLLYGCSFTVEKGASFYVGNLPVRLSAGTVIENRGYMDIHMTEANRLQIDDGASIVNDGELYLALGMDDPQEFVRSGAIVNRGILHTDV